MRYLDLNLPTGPLTRDELFAHHGIRGVELDANYARISDGRYVRADKTRDMDVLIEQAATRFPGGIIGFWGAAHLHRHRWMPWEALPAVFVEATKRTPVGAISLDKHLRGIEADANPAAPLYAVARDVIPASSIVEIGGVPCTSPLRTAFDLARIRALPEAVAAVDGLCAAVPGLLGDIRAASLHRDRAIRDMARFRQVAELASEKAESGWESRSRVMMHSIGLPGMVEQHSITVVIDGVEYVVRMDFANIRARTGVEFLGKHHKFEHNRRWDQIRAAALERLDWRLVDLDARAVTTNWTATVTMLRRFMAERIALGEIRGW